MKYLTPQQVYEQFGYHPKTTAEWADLGKIECIRSPGGHRRYPESAFTSPISSDKQRVLYARVSTRTQLEELTSQIDYLGKTYPGCRVVKDVASGMNWKRKNFTKLMTEVSNNEISEIVVGHKDRLCRFGFEFVEWFCNLHDCKITVINNAKLSSHEELMQDFMSIMHCFSSKLYFLRAYKKKIEEEQNISDIPEKNRSQCESI
ncbi:IS607 family transposase [Brasilonema octagenarum UFV-E1]|jgi:predicted site-specific integrase-resolvase|uniref:IS607 family transposase n=2 Tax=Brasilonema TaxID=383614 RepID=A0A856MKP5_9CYAN|nr:MULTISPECIES: IS607 family transposase [Brasilonema]NMF61648.1 IS607 family transposase [Brasilonema octagenarum UFV-OR1]QDL11112.1 IS607 family transposase [Brasilonema sennae CENA114]QDL17458.1 IS607 family transposase [Brasilonema octagenarum UFV-E1]